MNDSDLDLVSYDIAINIEQFMLELNWHSTENIEARYFIFYVKCQLYLNWNNEPGKFLGCGNIEWQNSFLLVCQIRCLYKLVICGDNGLSIWS